MPDDEETGWVIKVTLQYDQSISDDFSVQHHCFRNSERKTLVWIYPLHINYYFRLSPDFQIVIIAYALIVKVIDIDHVLINIF